jgi:uncharacterized membrane protein YeiH
MIDLADFNLILILDHLSTFAFALVGARIAAMRNMDYGGLLFVAAAAALSGGTFRNVILDINPAWINQPTLLLVIALAVVLTITFRWVKPVGNFIQLLDSLGLAIATIAGVALAVEFDKGVIPAVVLGVISGVLGGLVRDVLSQVEPTLLHRETNGTSAFLGAVSFVLALEVGLNQTYASVLAGSLVFAFRSLSIKFNWHLPKLNK